MLVRRLTPRDAAAYRTLRLAGLAEAPTAFASSHAEEAAWPIEVYAERLAGRADRGSFGAFEGETLVGVVTLGREDRPKTAHKAHIWGLYVDPGWRGQGVARLLLSAALELARAVPGVRRLNVSLNAANEPARRLYQSFGFQAYGREPDALAVDGVLHDELHMSLAFAAPAQSSTITTPFISS